jgi:REP-associated tyrosine transposase
MSKLRQVLPGQFYMLTRRCTQRLFLLRPDDATNNAFVYCLAVAAQRCEIDVLLTVAASNHHHTIIFDRHGRCSEFAEHFHRLMARSQNALRGRWENFWASEEPCMTRLLDRDAVVAKLIYAATNPVKDQLVERVHQWPGVNSYANFRSGRALVATRPRHFFRNPGPMPESIALEPRLPAELGAASEVIAEVSVAVEAIERQLADARNQTGDRVMGRRAVLAQRWNTSPQGVEPRRNLRPRFAGRAEVRVLALSVYGTFLDAYRRARKQWLAGATALFPTGTYWLSRFAGVRVATLTRG